MFCQKCGASLAESAQFCSGCGEKLGERNNSAPMPQTTKPNYTAGTQTTAVQAERSNKSALIYALIGIAVIIVIAIFLSSNSGDGSASRTMVGVWELSLQDGDVPLGLPTTITFAEGSSSSRGTGYYIGGVTNTRYDFTWSLSGGIFDMSRFPGDLGIIASMGNTEIEVDLKAGELTFWYSNGSWVEYTKR